MSGVYIPRMEMPEVCYDCPCCYDLYYCKLLAKPFWDGGDCDFDGGEGRLPDCPLVPVQEHDNADAHTIVLDKTKAFKFEIDDEEAQEQVIRDAKKYGLAAALKPKSGEWIVEIPSPPSAGYLKMRCSECKAEYTFISGTGFFFCPNCGSEMRGAEWAKQ